MSEKKNVEKLKWMKSTMSLQFSDLPALSLTLSVVPATFSDIKK